MVNYCDPDQVVALAQDSTITASYIQQDWLDWVDAMIEQYTGQGFKGATRVVDLIGDNTSILRLPSKAASITSIFENGSTTPLDSTQYRLSGTRLVERLNQGMDYSYLWFTRTWRWVDHWLYTVTYVEPTTVPDTYRLAAADCVRLIAQWTRKNSEFGIALTASDAGSAGKVSSAASTSFPANMVEEIHRTIQRAIRKPGI